MNHRPNYLAYLYRGRIGRYVVKNSITDKKYTFHTMKEKTSTGKHLNYLQKFSSEFKILIPKKKSTKKKRF